MTHAHKIVYYAVDNIVCKMILSASGRNDIDEAMKRESANHDEESESRVTLKAKRYLIKERITLETINEQQIFHL